MQDQTKLATRVASGTASLDDMRSLGGEAVALIKQNPDLLQIRSRGSDIITKSGKDRRITYLVSDETPDRVGDIIKVKGWDLSQYKKNPVILWAHDGSSVPPIGRANNVRRRYAPAPRLTADVEFAPKEAYEFADTIYQLAHRGFIRATSVGFLPKETMEVDQKDREKMGLGAYGQVFTKAELMEISVVAVPANPAALEVGVKQLINEGQIEKAMASRFFDQYPKDEETAAKKVRAICRSFVDFGALSSIPKSQTLTEESYNEENLMPKEDVVEKAGPNDLKVGDFVQWSASGGSAMGVIERIERDGKIEVPNSSFTITGTEDDPAALICLYRDEEKTDTRVGHKFSTLTKINKPSYASVDINQSETKSPACRQEGESKEECVERKIPELIEEGMKQDQAVAVANSVCETACSEKDFGSERAFVDAMATLVKAQAEQTKATRQLVDALSDLTNKIHKDLQDGVQSDGSKVEPEVAAPDVSEKNAVDFDEVLNRRLRGFADDIRRDILSNNSQNR